jgi:competence protein ComEC
VGEGANRVVTVINFLIQQVLGVIWRHQPRQSNVWTNFDEFKHKLFLWLEHWGSETTYFRRSLWLPVCFAVGAVTYFSNDSEPGFIIYGLGIAALVFCYFIQTVLEHKHQALPRFITLLVIWFGLGFGYSDFRTEISPNVPIRENLSRVMVEGWISDVSKSGNRERLTLRVHAISGVSPTELPRRVRLSLSTSSGFIPGRFVRCYGDVNPAPEPAMQGEYDFGRDAYFRGLGGVGFVYGKCRAGSLSQSTSPDARFMNNLTGFRRLLAAYIADHAGDGGGLAAALLTGDRSFLSEETQDTLRSSGLAHLLAISGLHMGLAGGALYFIFFRSLVLIEPLSKRFPVQKIAAMAALIGVTAYLFLSGASISAQRAYVMVGIAFLAVLFDMPVISFQTLGLALLGVLFLTPSAATTPGFQMSFAAAAALVRAFSGKPLQFFGQYIPVPDRINRFIGPIFLTSVVAGLATMPFAWFHFDRIAPLGILANFVVMPVVTFICVPLAVLSVIGMLVGLGDMPLMYFGKSLHLVVTMAEYFVIDGGRQSELTKGLPFWSFLLFVSGLIVWILALKPPWRILFLLIASGLIIWIATPMPQLIVTGNGYVAAHTVDGWRAIKLKNAGLIPLSLSDLRRVRCDDDCEIELPNAMARFEPDGNLLIEHSSGKKYNIPMQESTGISISKSDIKTDNLSFNKCRPWSTDWPGCRD